MIDQEIKKDSEQEIRKRVQLNAKSFGVVAYAEANFYSDDKQVNLEKSMPMDVDAFMEELEKAFNEKLKNSVAKVKNILAGHEHGKENGKCHYQCVVDLTCKGRITKQPGVLEHNGVKILYMFQETMEHKDLVRYCKKEKNYKWLRDTRLDLVFKKNKDGIDTEKVDVFSTIFRNKGSMSKEEASDLLCSHDARTYFTSYKNVDSAIDSLLEVEKVPFKWEFPEHLDKVKFAPLFSWFMNYCVMNPERKKALLLYSEKRALGKTRFAKSLVSDEAYYVAFRNTFSTLPSGKEPKLVILDDMYYTGAGDKVELWKALVAGEKTTIRDCHVNYNWDYEVPCIITTNRRSLVEYLMESPMFNTQIVFYEVQDYLGPPGTQPEDISKVETYMSQEFLEELRVKHEKKTERNEKQFDLKNFIERAALAQKVSDLETALQKVNKKRKIN